MPVSYNIDKDRRLVESFASGVFAKDDAAANQDQLLNDPDFDPGFSQIMDLTQVTSIEITEAELRYLAERTTFSAESRRAIVVGTDEAYGMARMFEIMRELKGDQGIMVVRSHKEAMEWLFPDEPIPLGK